MSYLVHFEPSEINYTTINDMTKVIIEPKLSANEKTKDDSVSKKFKNMLNFKNEWTSCFQVEFQDDNEFYCDQSLKKCNSLTSIELHSKYSPSAEMSDQIIGNLINGKYLVSLVVEKSPMQSLKANISNATQMRKFLQTIENSYPNSYYSNHENSSPVYALLNLVNFDSSLLDSNDKPRLKMSTFLRQQLKLFEFNSKVVVKAQSTDLEPVKAALQGPVKRRIKLKTNYSKTVKIYFIHFTSYYFSKY